MPPRKSPRTKVRTGVTTGTAVAMLFLTASAAFAAAAFTKMNPKVSMKIPYASKNAQADLAFLADKPGVANFSDQTTLQLQAVYMNTGSVEAGKHQSSYYFMDKNKAVLPGVRMDWGVDPIPAGGIKEVDVRVTNVPVDAVYIGLGVDTTNNVPESSETNNEMVIALNRSVAVAPSALPDFVFSASPAPSFSNGVLNYRWGNDGAGAGTFITGQAMVRVESLNASRGVIGVPFDFIAPATQQGNSATFPPHQMDNTGGAGYTLSAGATEIRITLDPDNRVTESNENNNITVVALPAPVAVLGPIVRLSSNSPAGAGNPGLNEVLRFTVVATANNNVVLNAVTFKTTTTDNSNSQWNINGDASGVIDTTAAWSLYDASDLSTATEAGDADWTLYATDGSTLNGVEKVGYARLALTNPITIAAGTSKTFVLKVDTTGAIRTATTSDTVRFDIIQENAAPWGSFLAALDEFSWSFRTINYAGAQGLPITGGTIIY